MKREGIILRNWFISFNKKPAFAGFFLFVLCSCGTTPPEVKNVIYTSGLAGHWSHYKGSFGQKPNPPVQDGYLYIGCDGNIKYKIDEPWALFFKEDSDDGSIKELKNNSVIYKNWLGFTRQAFLGNPITEGNGCKRIHFKNTSFSTYYPIDCSQPRKTFGEHLSEAYDHLKKNDYIFCD